MLRRKILRSIRAGSVRVAHQAALGGIIVFGSSACGTSSASRPPENPQAVAPATEGRPHRSSDETAEVVLAALRDRNFSAVAATFDAAVQEALPPQKLAAVWDAQVTELGTLSSWKIAQRSQVDGKDVRVVLLEFQRGALIVLLSISPDTQELSGIFFKPVPKPAAATAPYVDTAAFRVERISVGREPFVLPGRLTLPVGGGPFPGAVLVHGSGPNDMDESIGANRPFKDLAEGLASRGIAVLRYDKRTFHYRQLRSNDVTIEDEVVFDAVAALGVIKARPEIDGRRIFVMGHSLGALLAPEIAIRSASVAGAVLLAPPGRAPWDVLLTQMAYTGAPAGELAEIKKSIERMKAGQFKEGEVLGAPASYWQDWASRDGVSMARKLHKPLLLLRGERDYQVTDEDLAIWKTGLSGVENIEVATIPGANHLFIIGKGKPGPAEYQTPGHVDESVIARVAAFVASAK